MNIIASCLVLIGSWGMQVKSKTCFGSLGLATMNALCALPSDSIAWTSGPTVAGLGSEIEVLNPIPAAYNPNRLRKAVGDLKCEGGAFRRGLVFLARSDRLKRAETLN